MTTLILQHLILPYCMVAFTFLLLRPRSRNTSGESEQRSLYNIRPQMDSMKPSSCHCISLSDLNTLLTSFHELHQCYPPTSFATSDYTTTSGRRVVIGISLWNPPLSSSAIQVSCYTPVCNWRNDVGSRSRTHDLDCAPFLRNAMRCLELGGDSALLLWSTCCSTASAITLRTLLCLHVYFPLAVHALRMCCRETHSVLYTELFRPHFQVESSNSLDHHVLI